MDRLPTPATATGDRLSVGSSGERWAWRWLAASALLVGLAARVALLEAKPLWRDEAWMAWAIQQPLAEARRLPSPIGFMAASQVLDGARALAPEIRLRILPLVFGLAALPALGALALRLGAPTAVAAAALWLGAGLPGLVYSARELKHYSLDLFLAAVTPLLAMRLLDARPDRRWTAWLPLTGVAAMAPWVSFGGLFAVAAVLAWFTVQQVRAGTRRSRLVWALVVLIHLASLLGVFMVSVRHQASNRYLALEWEDEMPSARPHRALDAAGILADYFTTSADYLFPHLGLPALVLMAVGAWAWPGGRRRLVLWLGLGPAFAATAAALAGVYLFKGRLLLCAAPAAVLLVASGLRWVGETLAGRRGAPVGRWLGTAAGVALASWWSAQSVLHRVRPYRNDVRRYFLYDVLHDVAPLIDRVELLAAPGDAVMTSRYSGDQFRYYARGRLPQAMVCRRYNCRDEGPPLREWLGSVQGRGWMILLSEEDRPWRRRLVQGAGFDLRDASSARGALLWEVVRRRP